MAESGVLMVASGGEKLLEHVFEYSEPIVHLINVNGAHKWASPFSPSELRMEITGVVGLHHENGSLLVGNRWSPSGLASAGDGVLYHITPDAILSYPIVFQSGTERRFADMSGEIAVGSMKPGGSPGSKVWVVRVQL